MNKKVLEALNAQVNEEFASAYLYLSMSVAMQEAKYKGFASWLLKQSHEELEHAHDFINYIQLRDAQVKLSTIEMPAYKNENNDPLVTANAVLTHEKHITGLIYRLHELARNEKDQATEVFLQKYIHEQLEEENSSRDLVDAFSFAGESAAARYAVDCQLGHR